MLDKHCSRQEVFRTIQRFSLLSETLNLFFFPSLKPNTTNFLLPCRLTGFLERRLFFSFSYTLLFFLKNLNWAVQWRQSGLGWGRERRASAKSELAIWEKKIIWFHSLSAQTDLCEHARLKHTGIYRLGMFFIYRTWSFIMCISGTWSPSPHALNVALSRNFSSS